MIERDQSTRNSGVHPLIKAVYAHSVENDQEENIKKLLALAKKRIKEQPDRKSNHIVVLGAAMLGAIKQGKTQIFEVLFNSQDAYLPKFYQQFISEAKKYKKQNILRFLLYNYFLENFQQNEDAIPQYINNLLEN